MQLNAYKRIIKANALKFTFIFFRVGTGIKIDRLFLKLDQRPWGYGRNFYIIDLISSKTPCFLEKNRPQSQGQISKLKNLNKT
jgi:hypothetical protein